MTTRPAARRRAPSPIVLVMTGIVSVQLGAGVAKSLFDDVSPTSLTWLRLVASSVVLVAVVRPALRGRSRGDWRVVLGFGVTLGVMNWSIYQAFARIPIGLAVTLEFIGPLTVAVLGSRRARDLAWVVLAGAGVLLLGLERVDLTWSGVGFALLAAAAWAMYIPAAAATGRRWSGVSGLAVSSVVAALLVTPLAVSAGVSQVGHLRILGFGATLGVLSSVIPYTCELIALRSLRPAVFGILMSLEPAVAALAGFVVVHEVLRPLQLVAMGCVVAASIGATRSRTGSATYAEVAPD